MVRLHNIAKVGFRKGHVMRAQVAYSEGVVLRHVGFTT